MAQMHHPKVLDQVESLTPTAASPDLLPLAVAHLTACAQVLPAVITEHPQWLILTATPAIPHKLPAHLTSRGQSSPPLLTTGADWLVLTAKPRTATSSTSEQLKRSPVLAATTTLEDKVLEPFVPHRQRSFCSMVAIAVQGEKGKNEAGVFSCGKCNDMVRAGGMCPPVTERQRLPLD
ncbi:uncharacterized protein H6S33_011010 [Morchella sextelata]|uniref:uncharacterized protein n=1 Tax=Morchella sextelata TaxID=1174677 RepID=UPI001D04C8AC|nr:uncharacterized protein H6S33_011010 [Morchella sextelata]KAH0611745.1 hypothetical protein H6S33_011010 [Morchella sextelata]